MLFAREKMRSCPEWRHDETAFGVLWYTRRDGTALVCSRRAGPAQKQRNASWRAPRKQRVPLRKECWKNETLQIVVPLDGRTTRTVTV